MIFIEHFTELREYCKSTNFDFVSESLFILKTDFKTTDTYRSYQDREDFMSCFLAMCCLKFFFH